MTAMEDFYPAFLHYAVAMRLFEDTCRQLLDFQGSLEERSQIVDETARLALCVGDNIDDVESLLAPAAAEAAGDPALSEALSLISNTIREDRARADSYARWVTLRRIGGYDRAPRRPQVANPFVPLVQDGGQPDDDYEGEGEPEDGEEDVGTPEEDDPREPEREAVMPREPEDEDEDDSEEDGEEDVGTPEEDDPREPEREAVMPREPEDEDEGDEDEDDSEEDGEEDREEPNARPDGEDYLDMEEEADYDFDNKNSNAGRFFSDDDEDEDEETGDEGFSNPLAKEARRMMSENAPRRSPVAPANRTGIWGAPVTARRPVARTPLRRMVRRRWPSRSCSPLR